MAHVKRLVPSGITPWPCVPRIFGHRFVFGDWQKMHSGDAHCGVYAGTMWSPGLSDVTPAPGAYESSYGGGGGGGYGNYDTSGYGNSYAPAADYGSYNAYGNYPQSASV